MGMDALPVGLNVNKAKGDICALSLFCIECAYKTPEVLCKYKEQFCCCVQSGALPPTSDVPALCGTCFISCYPKFGVFKQVSELIKHVHGDEKSPGLEM